MEYNNNNKVQYNKRNKNVYNKINLLFILNLKN